MAAYWQYYGGWLVAADVALDRLLCCQCLQPIFIQLYDAGKTVSMKHMKLQVTQRRHRPLHLLLNCAQHISSCWSRCCQQAQVTHCYIQPGVCSAPLLYAHELPSQLHCWLRVGPYLQAVRLHDYCLLRDKCSLCGLDVALPDADQVTPEPTQQAAPPQPQSPRAALESRAQSVQNGDLTSLLMAWFDAGYQMGKHEASLSIRDNT